MARGGVNLLARCFKPPLYQPATGPDASSYDLYDDNVIDLTVPNRSQDDHIVNGRNALAALPLADCCSADTAGIRNVCYRHAGFDSLVPDVAACRRHIYSWHISHLLSFRIIRSVPGEIRTHT